MRRTSDVIARLKEITNFKFDNQLADLFEVPKNTFAYWKKATIPINILEDFCSEKNVSLDWLLLGRGSPNMSIMGLDGTSVTSRSDSNLVIPFFKNLCENMVVNKRLDMSGADGYIITPTMFSEGDTSKQVAFVVQCNSMMETLPVGSVGIIETYGVNEVENGKIYLFITDSGLQMRRFFHTATQGNYVVSSEDTGHDWDMTDKDFTIIGKVVTKVESLR